MADDPQINTRGKDLLVTVIINPGPQEGEAEVQDGEIAHLDVDHAHPMEETETEIEIETGTGGGIVIEIGTGTRIEILIEIEIRTEGEAVIERLRKDMTGFRYQRRRL